MQLLIEAVSYRIYMALANKSNQFCHPLRYRNGPTATFMGHRFDHICTEDGVEPRLTKPNHPLVSGEA